jgi:hypothetical protein
MQDFKATVRMYETKVRSLQMSSSFNYPHVFGVYVSMFLVRLDESKDGPSMSVGRLDNSAIALLCLLFIVYSVLCLLFIVYSAQTKSLLYVNLCEF